MGGTASPSFVTAFLERKAVSGASEEEEAMVNNVAYTVYGGAECSIPPKS